MKLQKGILTVLLGGAFLLTSCKCERKGEYAVPAAEGEAAAAVADTADASASKLDADGNYIYDIGGNTEITLPDGTKMTVGDNSTEYKLFGMLNDPGFQVSDDKTQGWISFDRVYFQTGKADLTDASKAQVENIIAILKAFPDATAKIGGYTDNTGTEEVNMKVSGDRAKTVADRIIAGGVDGARIASEGYGPNHFVCEANDTDECRAQNRRVDIRVTKK